MGKAILIFLLGSMVIFGVYNLYNNKNLKNSLQSSVNYYGDTEARNIGNTMMQMIFSQLADSNSWRVTTPQTKNFFNGSAQYTVVDTIFAGDTLVKANVFANYQGNTKTMVSYFHPLISNTPAFMSYAVLTGKDLTMSGDITIVPASGTTINANVHANGNVSISDGASTVNGFLTYGGTVTGNLSQIVHPVINPNNQAAYSQHNAITIPTFNPNDFSSIATTTYSGNKTMQGAVTLGTKSAPSIIVVQGNLTLTSATFTGYGAILVTGNVTLSQGNKITTSDPQGNTLGLYIAGNLNMDCQSEIDANIIALGSVTIGDAKIVGNLVSPNPITFDNCGTSVSYKPPVSAITQPFFPVASRPADIRYYLE
jgi:hypothetical protein